jgi:hypothetical protein
LGTLPAMSLLLALLMSAAISDEPLDAAHRADRDRTRALNRDAGKHVTRRLDRNDANEAAYRAARARYEADMAAWRRRVRACEAGDWSACDRP